MNKKIVLPLLLASPLLITACSESTPQKRTGETIYYQSCFSCHERGHGGAPIRGIDEQWEPRLAKGEKVILENMVKGYKGMPPKGACFDCTDKELQMALEFMLVKP